MLCRLRIDMVHVSSELRGGEPVSLPRGRSHRHPDPYPTLCLRSLLLFWTCCCPLLLLLSRYPEILQQILQVLESVVSAAAAAAFVGVGWRFWQSLWSLLRVGEPGHCFVSSPVDVRVETRKSSFFTC